MSFDYSVLNLKVLDDAREVFSKPSTHWTAQEHKKAVLIIEAMRIVASQSTELLQMNNAEPWSKHMASPASKVDSKDG